MYYYCSLRPTKNRVIPVYFVDGYYRYAEAWQGSPFAVFDRCAFFHIISSHLGDSAILGVPIIPQLPKLIRGTGRICCVTLDQYCLLAPLPFFVLVIRKFPVLRLGASHCGQALTFLKPFYSAMQAPLA